MTIRAAFVAGDWGTSNLTLALCDGVGQALETRKGPGAANSRGRFAEVFDELAADWFKAHGPLPSILCGMVGSAFGWREAPYLPCPADLHELAEDPIVVREGVSIVPGMRCTNPLGAPDVMRGEETQLSRRAVTPSVNEHRQAAGLHARHAHQVGVVERQRRAGIPHGAHGRAIRDAVRAQCAGARSGHAHRAPPARFRARARGVGQTSGGLIAPPAVPEPQPASRQAALGRGCGIVDVRACSSARMSEARCRCSRNTRPARRCT